MSSTGSLAKPVTRAEQARQTKAGILDVGLRLFAAHGFEATSMQDIADELSLTKAALYHYFPSKVEILRAICAPVNETMGDLLDQALTMRSRRQRIDALAAGLVDLMLERRGVLALMASNPVLHEQAKSASPVEELLEHAVTVIYGAAPTPDQRLGIYAVAGLGDALVALPDLPNDQLRPVLLRAAKRLVVDR
jgi:AcrR family transcriptional regulator